MLTVYTSRGCSACEAVVKDLDQRGVPYMLIDIDRSSTGAQELSRLTGGRAAVPTVVDERGEVLMGFGNT
jgi:glutaredoxin